jgi:hypothetical protein
MLGARAALTLLGIMRSIFGCSESGSASFGRPAVDGQRSLCWGHTFVGVTHVALVTPCVLTYTLSPCRLSHPQSHTPIGRNSSTPAGPHDLAAVAAT